jgi:PAS domain S-box-containing protein
MATEAELQKRIAELEAAQARAEILNQISNGLNTAHDEDELLQILAWPAIETGAIQADLIYIDLDEAGEPEWTEVVAIWRQEGEPPKPVGSRFYVPEFPLTHLWMANPDEPQLVTDLTTDERVDENTRNLMARGGIRARATIPLAQAGRWVGLILLHWDEPHEFNEQEAEIYRALISLASPVVENRRLLDRTQKALSEIAVFRALVENSVDAISMDDLGGQIIYANRSCYDLYGYDYEGQEMIGLNSTTLGLAEEVPIFVETIWPQVKAGGWSGEMRQQRKDGTQFHASHAMFPVRDAEGQIIGTTAIVRDITAQKEAEAEREHLQQEVIEAQKQALQELSTPIIPIMERIIVMPLIGSIDTMRAKDIMRALLAGIRNQRAKVVILDITGVPIVDSGVANHLNKTIQAARLKGAHTIVTGLSDAVAETIVDLGIDWGNIETLSDLQTGLLVALNSMGIKLTRS